MLEHKKVNYEMKQTLVYFSLPKCRQQILRTQLTTLFRPYLLKSTETTITLFSIRKAREIIIKIDDFSRRDLLDGLRVDYIYFDKASITHRAIDYMHCISYIKKNYPNNMQQLNTETFNQFVVNIISYLEGDNNYVD